MTTTLLRRAAPAARKVLRLAGPGLLLGVIAISQVQARIQYPPGPAGNLQRRIDDILIKERADILLQGRLVIQQDQASARLGVLEQQIQQATDPAVIAFLQRQFNQQAARFNSLQVAINRNSLVLQNNLNVLNPQKDRLIALLGTLPRPQNQISLFIQSATQQQNTYAAVMRVFLTRRPLSPVVPF